MFFLFFCQFMPILLHSKGVKAHGCRVPPKRAIVINKLKLLLKNKIWFFCFDDY